MCSLALTGDLPYLCTEYGLPHDKSIKLCGRCGARGRCGLAVAAVVAGTGEAVWHRLRVAA